MLDRIKRWWENFKEQADGWFCYSGTGRFGSDGKRKCWHVWEYYDNIAPPKMTGDTSGITDIHHCTKCGMNVMGLRDWIKMSH